MKTHVFSIIFALAVVIAVAALAIFLPNFKPENKTPVNKKTTAVSADDISAALSAPPEGGYRIFALRQGVSEKAKKRLFVDTAKKNERFKISFSFWLIQGNEKNILVDTGFTNPKKIQQWKITGYSDPVALLAKLDLTPVDITDIIITHRHWDHIGGLHLFDNARVFMNEGEFNDALKKYKKRDKKIFKALLKASEEERLIFTSGLQTVMPGITIVRQGAHTRRFQFVVVNNLNGVWALASDEGPMYENYKFKRASGQTLSKKRSLATIDNILILVSGDMKRIIPGHEPEVFSLFKKVSKNIIEIK